MGAFHRPRKAWPGAVVFKHLGDFLFYLADSFLQQNVDCYLQFTGENRDSLAKSNLKKVQLRTQRQDCPLASVFWGFGNNVPIV